MPSPRNPSAAPPSIARIAIGVLAGLVILPGGALLAVYGTLSPCSALKTAVRGALTRQAARNLQDPLSSVSANLGTILGAALAGPIIDSIVDGFGPLQCTRVLARYHFEGGDALLQAELRRKMGGH